MRLLITGAASGLGAALARQGAQMGQVTALDVAPMAGADAIRHDMADPDPAAWARLADSLRARGPYHLVVLNAGISATGRFEDIELPTQLAVTRVNLSGPMQLTRLLLAEGLLAPGARLVFVASLSCFTGYPGAASYAASKDGLASFARSLRRPLRRQKVWVQLLCPGPMDTPHATRHAPEGASAKGRAAPEMVARKLLAAPRRRFVIVPGAGPILAAGMGRIFPQTMTRIMGRVLFHRLTTGR